jgi:hypothetical protein
VQHFAYVKEPREPTLDDRSRDVLVAADNWLTAIQAMTAADEAQSGTEDQQTDLDDAEVALVVAVKLWRKRGLD